MKKIFYMLIISGMVLLSGCADNKKVEITNWMNESAQLEKEDADKLLEAYEQLNLDQQDDSFDSEGVMGAFPYSMVIQADQESKILIHDFGIIRTADGTYYDVDVHSNFFDLIREYSEKYGLQLANTTAELGEITKKDDKTYFVRADADLNSFFDECGLEKIEGAVSIGEWLSEKMEHPALNEEYTYKNITFKIIYMKEGVISSLIAALD